MRVGKTAHLLLYHLANLNYLGASESTQFRKLRCVSFSITPGPQQM